VLKQAPSHEDVWVSGHKGPRILKLGTGWRGVISFTSRPLYPRGKSPPYLSDNRMGEPQSHLGAVKKTKMCWTLEGLTPVIMDSMIFRAVTPCNSVGVHHRFGGMYRFHLQVRIIAQEAACCLFLAWFTVTLKMETEHSCETSVIFYRTTWLCNLENHTFRQNLLHL
jgi:hypothetical protein